MQEIFKAAIDRRASDIHIKSGDVIRARIDGNLVPLTQQRLSPEQVKAIALKLMPHEQDRQNFDQIMDYDCSWGLAGIGRFRVNIARQRGTPMIIMRVIPFDIPTIEDLELPPIIEEIAHHERGLILVTGVTGSGKSSTMAAMINWMNQNKRLHIVTLENPVEFLHRDIQCSITQRDIGTDTDSFVSGLRSVLRQDPDVILIGEMRDKVTIETALKAAETGHLVVSTLHTKNAVQTISRVIAVFDSGEQEMLRIRLSEQLMAVISQRLIQRKSGGRIAAMEIMPVSATIRDCIKDKNRLDEIGDLIEEGKDHYGSQTFDQHLMDLVKRDLVDFDVAKAAANNPADFDLKMNMFNDPRSSKPGSSNLHDEMSHLFREK